MAIVRAPVHLTAGDDVDPRPFLVVDRSLAGAILRIGHRCHRQLAYRHQPVERFVPIRHAVGADHGGGIFRIKLQKTPAPLAVTAIARLAYFLGEKLNRDGKGTFGAVRLQTQSPSYGKRHSMSIAANIGATPQSWQAAA